MIYSESVGLAGSVDIIYSRAETSLFVRLDVGLTLEVLVNLILKRLVGSLGVEIANGEGSDGS